MNLKSDWCKKSLNKQTGNKLHLCSLATEMVVLLSSEITVILLSLLSLLTSVLSSVFSDPEVLSPSFS